MPRGISCILPFVGNLLAWQSQPTPGLSEPAAKASDTVALIGTKRITLAEVDKQLTQQLLDLEEKAYQLRRNALEGLVNRYLVEQEAEGKGQTIEEYLKTAAAPQPVSESEIEALVKQQRSQRPQALEFEVQTQVRTHLEQIAKQKAFEAMLRDVRRRGSALILLRHPTIDLSQVVTERDAVRGSAEAPV